MSLFEALKKKSNIELDSLKEKIEQTQNPSQSNDKDDDRFWKPSVDKAGNGMAVIRFLPTSPKDGDSSPWVSYFSHGFNGVGGWFIENCPTTMEESCPVCESNRELWATKIDANREIVRKRKRKLSYIANIYIIDDPMKPENNGKVKLYKFGVKIFEKLQEAMNPVFEDETPLNPFDLWKGANFKMKIRNVGRPDERYWNYDKSEFDKPSALFDDDEVLEKIWNQEYAIQGFVDPQKFKSYDVLKDRLEKVLGLKRIFEPTDDSDNYQESNIRTSSAPVGVSVDDSDDDLAYFQKLADE